MKRSTCRKCGEPIVLGHGLSVWLHEARIMEGTCFYHEARPSKNVVRVREALPEAAFRTAPEIIDLRQTGPGSRLVLSIGKRRRAGPRASHAQGNGCCARCGSRYWVRRGLCRSCRVAAAR